MTIATYTPFKRPHITQGNLLPIRGSSGNSRFAFQPIKRPGVDKLKFEMRDNRCHLMVSCTQLPKLCNTFLQKISIRAKKISALRAIRRVFKRGCAHKIQLWRARAVHQ